MAATADPADIDTGHVERLVGVILKRRRAEEAVGLRRFLWTARPSPLNRERYVRALADLEALDAQWDVLTEGMSLEGVSLGPESPDGTPAAGAQ